MFWNLARYEQDYFKRGVWVSTSRGDPKYYEFDPLDSVGPDTETTWEEMRVDLADFIGEPIYLSPIRHRAPYIEACNAGRGVVDFSGQKWAEAAGEIHTLYSEIMRRAKASREAAAA